MTISPLCILYYSYLPLFFSLTLRYVGELDQISIFPRLIKMLKAQARRQETEGTQKNLRVYHLMTPKKKCSR